MLAKAKTKCQEHKNVKPQLKFTYGQGKKVYQVEDSLNYLIRDVTIHFSHKKVVNIINLVVGKISSTVDLKEIKLNIIVILHQFKEVQLCLLTWKKNCKTHTLLMQLPEILYKLE